MSLRRDLADLFARESGASIEAFADRAAAIEGVPVPDERRRALADGVAAWDGPDALPADALDARERDLVARAWLLGDAPLGVVVAGPAYRDTPIVYATRPTRALTGYDLSTLRGANPRLLQGPATEPDAVAALRDAIRGWTRTSVTVTNYRRDGTPFRNRVTLIPLYDDGGVDHWVGLQGAVDGEP